LEGQAREFIRNGRYEEAADSARRAAEMVVLTKGAEHPDLVPSLNLLALVAEKLNHYGPAEALLRRALKTHAAAFGEDDPTYALLSNNLACVHSHLAARPDAESLRLTERASEIFKGRLGVEHPLFAVALNSLAYFHYKLGELDRAEALYRQAHEIFKKALGAGAITPRGGLGSPYGVVLSGDAYPEATLMWEPVRDIGGDSFEANYTDAALTLNNLGVLYRARRDYARAEMSFRDALKMLREARGGDDPLNSLALSNLAGLYQEGGDYSRAEALYQESLTLIEKRFGGRAGLFEDALNKLAVARAAQGDAAGALRLAVRSQQISEKTIKGVAETGWEDSIRVYMQQVSEATDFFLTLHLFSLPHDREALRLALNTILQRKGRVIDAMSGQAGALRRSLEPRDHALLERLLAVREQLARLALGGGPPSDVARTEAEMKRLKVENQRLEQEINKRSVKLRAQAQAGTLEAVRESIPQGAALVEIVSYRRFDARARTRGGLRGQQRFAAYVLERDGEPSFVDLGAADPINRACVRLRESLAGPRSADFRESARALDELVMRPVRRLLGRAQTLLISPDGALNLIPFAALVDENNRYLLETHLISYLTSGRDLLRVGVRAPSRAHPVVIADPAFDAALTTDRPTPCQAVGAGGRRSVDFRKFLYAPLPNTAAEASAIREVFGTAQVLTGAGATESAVKQVAAPWLLHIATHGFFLSAPAESPDEAKRGFVHERRRAALEENPLLRSGLVLAGVKSGQGGGGEDGVLTALEVAGLDLWGTKLVVLSACDTGLGDVTNGEGVYGLRRALVLAGAESQLISLWRVSDTGTLDLMARYYHLLGGRAGRAEALRQVQLEFLRRPARAHPFYWAGFILAGDWGTVTVN
jgi:CHAT domain-containing protein/tetratricopeptide (TPR) repeat protein